MKRILFSLLILEIILLLFLILAPANAQTSNATNLEVPIMGETEVSDIPSYIVLVYQFAVGIVGLAALIMIVIGAYLYMTSHGNASQAEKGKEYITDAILGLIIVLVSYVILRTINPNLVGNFGINLNSMKTNDSGSGIPWRRAGQGNQVGTAIGGIINNRYISRTRDLGNPSQLVDSRRQLVLLSRQLDDIPEDAARRAQTEIQNYINSQSPVSSLNASQISDEMQDIRNILTPYLNRSS